MMYLAIDVYGTLVDTAGVTDQLAGLVGDRAPEFATAWRAKQLEYTFRRALMHDYADLPTCTRQALDHTCLTFGTDMAATDRDALMALYRRLPAFADAEPGLRALRDLPLRPFAFSNGNRDDLDHALEAAALAPLLAGVVSLNEARTFKPHPAAYAYFHRAAQTGGAETWLVSGNPFDVIGAVTSGMHAVWIKRSPTMVFDPIGVAPTAVVSSLIELAALFRERMRVAK